MGKQAVLEKTVASTVPKRQERVHYIDYIRVFAILMVILLHCICDYYVDGKNFGRGLWYVTGYLNELCRTGVPLFFMISGYLLLGSDIPSVGSFYKRRFMKILIPFLVYDVFYYLTLTDGTLSVSGFLKELCVGGSGYHFWFIYSILFIYLMIPFVKMVCDRCNDRLIWVFLLIITFQTTIKPFINTISGDNLYIYLTEDGVVGYLGYVVLGLILGRTTLTSVQKTVIYALGIASFVLIPYFSMRSVLGGGQFLFHSGYSLNHYLEAAALFVLAKSFLNRPSRLVIKLSSASLGAYFIHVYILEKLKDINIDTTPSVRMLIWAVTTVAISFAWGFVENYIKSIKIKR